MRLHKEALGAIVQINVEWLTENLKNFDAVVLSKLIECVNNAAILGIMFLNFSTF